jgi:hypothetical protein
MAVASGTGTPVLVPVVRVLRRRPQTKVAMKPSSFGSMAAW